MPRAPHRLRRLAAAAAILVLTAALSSCDQGAEQTAEEPAAGEPAAPEAAPAGDLMEREDPVGRVYSAALADGKVARFEETALPPDAVSMQAFERVKEEKAVADRPTEKIHPLLRTRLAAAKGGETELVVVTFGDDYKIPRFPEPDPAQARDSEHNRRALSRAEELVARIQQDRGRAMQEKLASLRDQQAEVVETFWLVNAALVRMPLSSIEALAKRDDVLYVEPDQTTDIPPQDGNNDNDVADGRARIVSDPYFNLGQTGGFIGLLDTGMRFTHTQFTNPDHVDFQLDCVNGGSTCAAGTINPNDDCWDHGTGSGAIITANAVQGDAFRGVTAITLDSLKVYPTSFDGNNLCNGGLDTSATIRAFERAVAILDRVIVAEMQASADYLSSISLAADAAFDAGAVVIAANGNNGPNAGTVNAPASAHRVIGVGNFDVQTQAQINGQSRGPTPDNRFKPDIQTPTNTETASNGCGWMQNCTTGGSNTALGVFGGTSGATPYAGGAAALLRNWLRGTSSTIDPGQVYAHLILSGQQPYPFNNTSGAGPIQLPTNGTAWWGKVDVTDGATIDIPIGVGAGTGRIDAALWWPETATKILWVVVEVHNDIDLHIVDPGGVGRAFSVSIPSVFERARVTGSIAAGTWKIRIRGFDVNTTSQTVYWAAHARP